MVGQGARSVASGLVPGTRKAPKRPDEASVDGYLRGQIAYELASEFGIERRTVSAIPIDAASRCDGATYPSRRRRKRSR